VNGNPAPIVQTPLDRIKTLDSGFYLNIHSLSRSLGNKAAEWLCILLKKQATLIKTKEGFDKDSEIFFTLPQFQTLMTISNNTHFRIIKTLKDLGIITVVKKGLPAKNFYRIHEAEIYALVHRKSMDKSRENLCTKLELIKQESKEELFHNSNPCGFTEDSLKEGEAMSLDRRDESSLPSKEKRTQRLKESIRNKRVFEMEANKPKYHYLTERYCLDNWPIPCRLFRYWLTLPNVRKTRWKMKSTETAMIQLNKALKEFPPERIKESMAVYDDLLKEPFTVFTYPQTSIQLNSAVNIGIDGFFVTSPYAKKVLSNNPLPEAKILLENKSLFSICLKGFVQAKAILASGPTAKPLNEKESLILNVWKKYAQEDPPNEKLLLMPKMVSILENLYESKYKFYTNGFGTLLLNCFSNAQEFFSEYAALYLLERVEEDDLQFHYLASENFYYQMEKYFVRKGSLEKL